MTAAKSVSDAVASRRSVRSEVDFVLTFEELMGLFEAKYLMPLALANAGRLGKYGA